MGKCKWELCFGMIGHGEGGEAPSYYRMATLALSAVGALCELAMVRIRLVAVGTNFVRDRRFEIAALMTGIAWKADVLPLQSELRLRVIEGSGEARLLPCGRGVARIAPLFECTLVGIAMAVRAVREFDTGIARLIIQARSVTALTYGVTMLTGEWKLRLRVIEILAINFDGFPV
jgi:hypothetical protein